MFCCYVMLVQLSIAEAMGLDPKIAANLHIIIIINKLLAKKITKNVVFLTIACQSGGAVHQIIQIGWALYIEFTLFIL